MKNMVKSNVHSKTVLIVVGVECLFGAVGIFQDQRVPK